MAVCGHGCGARRGDRRGRVLASGACRSVERTRQRHRHRSGRPDRLRPAVPDRLRPAPRPRHAGPAAAAGDPAGRAGRRGGGAGAAGLRVPAAVRRRHHRRRHAGVRRRQRRAARRRPPAHEGHGARRPAGGQRRHLRPAGRAINAGAADDVRVLVVGNPANTNALIAQAAAPDVPGRAVHRDDPARPQPRRRAARREARRAGRRGQADDDLGQPLRHPVPRPLPRRGRRQDRRRAGRRPPGCATTFIPTVAKRGAEIIEVRGASSAASAANAAIDHVFDWVNGTADGDWTSAALASDGAYGVPEGLISSFPVTSENGALADRGGPGDRRFSRARIDASVPSSARSATPYGARPDLRSARRAHPAIGPVGVRSGTAQRPVVVEDRAVAAHRARAHPAHHAQHERARVGLQHRGQVLDLGGRVAHAVGCAVEAPAARVGPGRHAQAERERLGQRRRVGRRLPDDQRHRHEQVGREPHGQRPLGQPMPSRMSQLCTA